MCPPPKKKRIKGKKNKPMNYKESGQLKKKKKENGNKKGKREKRQQVIKNNPEMEWGKNNPEMEWGKIGIMRNGFGAAFFSIKEKLRIVDSIG